MAWWSRFDPADVESDFERFAAAGLDSVRMFLLWEDFQPDARRVNRDMVGRLVAVADAADRAGLELMSTLFTGHMSGVNWIPPWALGGTERDERFRVMSGGRIVGDGIRNWYADEEVAQAQVRLATEVATALAGHDALWAWDLGNESSNCGMPSDREHARQWLEQMTTAIRGADATALVTIGLHMEDLEQDRRLGPAEAAEFCDFLTMHGYPIYATWAGGAADEHLVPFLARLTRWLGDGADVVFSEFGLPTFPATFPATSWAGDEASPMLVSEQDAARYTGQVLAGLHDAGCAGAIVWCSADYAPAIWSDPPLDAARHERTFGLWRSDGSAKPAVSEITAFGRRSRLDPPDDDWIDIDHERYWEEPATQLPRLYRRFREGKGA
jgi:endo-1,4-beta-mannosidase